MRAVAIVTMVIASILMLSILLFSCSVLEGFGRDIQQRCQQNPSQSSCHGG